MVEALPHTDSSPRADNACPLGASIVRRLLHALAIPFSEVDHRPVATAADASFIKERLPGLGCKSLLLRHGKHRHDRPCHDKPRDGTSCLLVCLPDEKRCDLRALATRLGTGRLSLAGVAAMQELLGVLPGAVSPLALVNDADRRVRVFFDHEFVGQNVLVHPLVNTKTLSMSFADLVRLLEATGHDPGFFHMP